MRTCDRHNRTPAKDEIHIRSSDEHFDLCGECMDLIESFLASASKDPIEAKPRKRGFLGIGKNSAIAE